MHTLVLPHPVMLFLTYIIGLLFPFASAFHCSSYGGDSLAFYRVTLQTFWTREDFPRQYPEWRPHAQWSKLIGASHVPSYVLFRVSEVSPKSTRTFAENADSSAIDALHRQTFQDVNGTADVGDSFSAPAIKQGDGTTWVDFWVDSRRSMVSLMSRIIPSPDWFVGVDALNLCAKDGKWISNMTIKAGPIDAGADDGLTFTAPNWPSDPPQPVRRMTHDDPSHPASSFRYPHKLPTLATFTFLKLKEMREDDNVHHSTSSSKKIIPRISKADVVGNEIDHQRDSSWRDDPVEPLPKPLALAPPVSLNVIDDVEYRHANKHKKKREKKHKRKQHEMRDQQHPRDCRVSEWGEWSACSRSCGIGESLRRRTILVHAKRGGRSCPPLTDRTWCGSARNKCNARLSYFNW